MERAKRMFYFVVGDVIAKRDLLGLFSQSDYVTAEELYDAYKEKISQITEEICRDEGWKKPHWTKILQAIETAFGSELDRDDGGQLPPALQKEMIETAREIQKAIFQSPAYYPELLQCSEEEKEECLKTVISLYRLWDCIQQQGGLALFVPNAPLLDACFDFPEYDIDGIRRIEKIFRQCMVTEGFVGGNFLNNAAAAEGVLLYLRFFEKACSMSRVQWGQELCDAVKGLFGPDFEGRVEACVEREAKMHFSLDEEIPFEPLSIDWPEIENWEIEEEKAAHIRFCAVEEMKTLDGAGFDADHLDIPNAALLEIPPYLSRQIQTEEKEKEEILESVAKIFRAAFDMEDEDGAGRPDAQKFRKENRKRVALGGDDNKETWGWEYKNFAEYRMIAEGLGYLLENPAERAEDLCCMVKSMLGMEYVKQVEQIFKNERKAYRRRKRRDTPSVVPEFDALAKISQDECARVLAEIPENTLAYALKGAGDEVEDLIWRSLPEDRRQEVEEDLDIVLNVLLKDVKEAQKIILEKAKQMVGDMLEER